MNPTSQDLHNRAFESARETRQLLTTMATGSLGVFFLAMTSKDPISNPYEKFVLIWSTIAMAFTIFTGVYGAYADAQWSYYWAKQLECEDALDRQRRSDKREKWHRVKRLTEQAMMYFFVIGIAIACMFIAIKLFPQDQAKAMNYIQHNTTN